MLRRRRGTGALIWIVAVAGTTVGLMLWRDRNRRRGALARQAIRRSGGRLPRVVIVGGGLGGLFCARALRDAPCEVLVLDRVNHYLYQALIYQVATAQLGESEVAMPIRERLGDHENTYVALAEVEHVDVESRLIHVRGAANPISYDFLVLATGLEPDYFGHDEWREHAPPLKTLRDALVLRERILAAFEEAELLADPTCCPELTTFVLVGGGPTGVEMAGALADMVHHTLPRDFKRFDPTTTRIVLVEAADRVLPTFAPDLSAKVHAKLTEMGVEIRLGEPVEEIDAEGVVVGGERIASKNVIWTAGVRATSIGVDAGLATDEMGRILVNPDLSVPGHREVYAIGDLARIDRGDGEPLPAVAQVALQSGRYVGRSITLKLTGRPLLPWAPGGTPPRPFTYFDKGTLATVGHDYAVMETLRRQVRMAGIPAKLVWVFIHLLYQMPNADKITMFTKWVWLWVTRRLGTRVIVDPSYDLAEQLGIADPPADRP